MPQPPKKPDSNTPKSDAELRAERRAAALRANLHRRKSQARGRTDTAAKPQEARDDTGS